MVSQTYSALVALAHSQPDGGRYRAQLFGCIEPLDIQIEKLRSPATETSDSASAARGEILEFLAGLNA
jgi:hypothetical protein